MLLSRNLDSVEHLPQFAFSIFQMCHPLFLLNVIYLVLLILLFTVVLEIKARALTHAWHTSYHLTTPLASVSLFVTVSEATSTCSTPWDPTLLFSIAIFLTCSVPCRYSRAPSHGSPHCQAAAASPHPAPQALARWQRGYRTQKKWTGVLKVSPSLV